MLIFSRVGTIIHFAPGFGDKYVPVRIRLAFGLTLSFVLCPLIKETFNETPISGGILTQYIVAEIIIGTIIGLAIKIIYLAMHLVGSVIAMQSGLGAATFFDLSQKEQVTIFSGFLLLTTTMAIFATDTHHLFIQSALESYERFPIGMIPNMGDSSNFIAKVVNNGFIVSFKIMAPFLIVSLAMLVGAGVLARLMPNLQVFFVLTPVQIIVMFITLFIVFQEIIEYIIKLIQEAAKMHGII
jgi:flagellar biosynthetic protein FliR